MEYQLIRSNRKSVSISFDQNFDVVVKAPFWLGEEEIDGFVGKKAGWIADTRLRLQNEKLMEVKTRIPLASGDRLPYLGRELILTVIREPRKRVKVSLHNDRLLMWAPYDAGYEMRRLALVAWYRKQAAYVIGKKAAVYAERMGVSYQEIHIKDQRTRWGSCSNMKNLNFSWRLIMTPNGVCDYVIIHELCHLVYMNHSPEFWALVAKMCPPYKQQKKWLRESAAKLYFI